MGAKAEIGWTRRLEDGTKLDVYAQHVGREWLFYSRTKRNEQWQRIKAPPLVDWLELLDTVARMVPRRRFPPAEMERLRQIIREKFPEAKP